jgi:hypothetical protein
MWDSKQCMKKQVFRAARPWRMHGFCNSGTTTADVEYQLRTPSRRVFTRLHQYQRERSPFLSAEHQARRNVEDEGNVTDLVRRGLPVSTRRMAARLSIQSVTNVPGLHTRMYHTERLEHLEHAALGSRVQLSHSINANRKWFVTCCFSTREVSSAMETAYQKNSNFSTCDNPHGTVVSSYQQRLSVNMWRDVFVTWSLDSTTSAASHVLQHELLTLLRGRYCMNTTSDVLPAWWSP